jgi:hypothetical protein
MAWQVLDHLRVRAAREEQGSARLAEVVPAYFGQPPRRGPPRTIRIDGDIELRALAPIEATLPCARKRRGQDPCDDPLAILDDRLNIDKHRTRLFVVG